jgi:hypothetical protein
MFLKNLSIIYPFAQIVRGRRRRRRRRRSRRRLGAPRPGGDFVAPGKNICLIKKMTSYFSDANFSSTPPYLVATGL